MEIRVANLEMNTSRIFVVKTRVANVNSERDILMSYMSHGTKV